MSLRVFGLSSALGAVVPVVVTIAALAGPSASHAQYKIVGPDGKISYTDREPVAAEGRVTALGARGAAQLAAEPELPFELRQIANRYPVTLYTTLNACEPCVLGRQLLRQRGIPYAERQVVTPEDSDALERIAGAREAPTLTIGAQTVRGFAAETWASYLDAAGYPRESRLPASYQYRAATPIIERRDAVAVRPGGTPAGNRPAAATTPIAPTQPGTGGIRF